MNKLIIIFFTLIANVFAQLSIRKGMMNIDVSSLSFAKLMEIVSSLHVWAGLISYGISFVLYLYLVSIYEVSRIYPVIIGIAFILIFVFSVLFLDETINLKKILGILFISAGVIILF